MNPASGTSVREKLAMCRLAQHLRAELHRSPVVQTRRGSAYKYMPNRWCYQDVRIRIIPELLSHPLGLTGRKDGVRNSVQDIDRHLQSRQNTGWRHRFEFFVVPLQQLAVALLHLFRLE